MFSQISLEELNQVEYLLKEVAMEKKEFSYQLSAKITVADIKIPEKYKQEFECWLKYKLVEEDIGTKTDYFCPCDEDPTKNIKVTYKIERQVCEGVICLK